MYFKVLYKTCNVFKKSIKFNVTIMNKLIAFDFDHTIIDKNSDVIAMEMLPKNSIPESLRKLYKEDGWTSYMQGIFKLLHENNIKQNTIKEVMENLEPTKGMITLIKELSEKLNYDIIIISDSNSYFINAWLEKNCLKDNIMTVFTNPANFNEEGLLNINMYHLQQHCKLSTKNLCKGQILEDFIENQYKNGKKYEKIVYVGDGTNDFCPILRLTENDLAFARCNYKLCAMVKGTSEGKSVDKTGIIYKIKAPVITWNTGYDILKSLTDVN